MLLRGTDVLKQAAAAGHALPGFVAYNLETVQGITAAAEAAGRPVLIQAGSSPFKHAGRAALMRSALDAAEHTDARLGVHLDLSLDLDEITACLQAGCTFPHGASGLPVEELHGALARGVAKVNVNAEPRRAYLEAVRTVLPAALPGSDAVSVWAAGRDAVRDAALEVIGRLSPAAGGGTA